MDPCIANVSCTLRPLRLCAIAVNLYTLTNEMQPVKYSDACYHHKSVVKKKQSSVHLCTISFLCSLLIHAEKKEWKKPEAKKKRSAKQ